MFNLIETLYNLADNIHSQRLFHFYKNKKIDCVIDVGSHKGEFISKVIRNKNLPIFSFEPQKKIIKILKKNTRQYNIKKYFNYALSDFDGKINMHINVLSSTSSLLKTNEFSFWIKFKKFILGNKLYSGIQKTEVRKMDDVLKNNLKIYKKILIKIDVEGLEAKVLKGSYNIIKSKNIAFIQIEHSNFNIYRNKNNADYYLNKYGYVKRKIFTFPFLNFSDVIYEKKVY